MTSGSSAFRRLWGVVAFAIVVALAGGYTHAFRAQHHSPAAGGPNIIANNKKLASSSFLAARTVCPVQKRRCGDHHHGANRRSTSTIRRLTMYFDDVSRHHVVSWNPSSAAAGSSSSGSYASAAAAAARRGGEEISAGAAGGGFSTPYQPRPQSSGTTTAATKTTTLAAESNCVDISDDSNTSSREPTSSSILGFPSYAEQRAVAIRRMILGYDARSASALSPEEVVEQTELWSTEAGVVVAATGRRGADKASISRSSLVLGDELYGRLLGTSVCPATDLVTAVSQLWNEIAAILRAHTDELSPTKWTTTSAAREGSSVGGGREAEEVHFVVFPACPDLYDYKTMVTFVTAIEFAKEHCLHVGKRLTVGIFHPNYRHSPKLLSPERHSPFPTVALQLEDASSTRHRQMRSSSSAAASSIPQGHDSKPKRQRGNHVVVRRSGSQDNDEDDDDDDPHIAQLAYGKIHDLDAQRSVFEVLFNSAAVPGSDGHPVGRIGKADVIDESDLMAESNGVNDDSNDGEKGRDHELAKTFRIERQVRSRRLEDRTVKEVCRNWMSQNRFVDRARRKENRALRYADTIGETRWTISTEKIAEMEYAKIWTVISELWTIGQRADREREMLALQSRRSTKTIANATESEISAGVDSASPRRTDSSPSSNQFFLFLPFANNRPASPSDTDKTRQNAIRRPAVIESSILVSTKFCAFNAPAFKRFAITVNAALKRFTKGRMFLEVFHNEYVGQDGFDPSLRRSPFPMIQVCYLANSTHNND